MLALRRTGLVPVLLALRRTGLVPVLVGACVMPAARCVMPAATAEARAPHPSRAAGVRRLPVLVLERGRVRVRVESFAGPSELHPTRREGPARMSPGARRGRLAFGAQAKGAATQQALDQLLAQGEIDQPTHDARAASLDRAVSAWSQLTGTRKAEMGAVIDNADAIAAGGQLTPSRLPAVFETLDANAQWWTNGSLPSPDQRVSIGDSELIWEYYPGQGLELQMLANFSKANALWSSGDDASLRALLNDLVPLAADRGGWPAWEYYFRFDGGAPPWTSSISQGTAIQALARAGKRLQDPSLTALGQRALAAFQQPPPAGVRLDTPSGPFYLIYSFATNQLVINAHLQAVIGLYDFGKITGDPTAQALFQQGDAEAQAVLPHYDTGHWSLYDQSTESDLNYHQLVTTFLQNLCQRTHTPIYCDTAARFKAYLHQPPTVTLLTRIIRSGAPAHLAFTLDKISRVGVTVSTSGGATVLSTSSVVGRGMRFITWSKPARAGRYQLRLRATDLAGNQSAPAIGSLRILPGRRAAHRRHKPKRRHH